MGLPFILHTAGIEWEQIVDHLPLILVGLVQILLSIALIWHNISRNPELRILGPDIQPESGGETVAERDHIKGVRFRDKVVEIVKPDMVGPCWKGEAQIVCWKMPSNLRLLFDIANIGLSGITVHDYGFEKQVNGRWELGRIVALFPESYAYRQTFAVEKKNITREKHEQRVYLEAHGRLTEVFDFPWDGELLGEGKHRLRISVYAGSHRKPKASKIIDINIRSSGKDKTVIRWTR